MSREEKPKTPYHHGALGQELVAYALAQVRAHGAEAVSLREAARNEGVTPGAIYKHFADREALLVAVAQEGFALISARVRDSIGKRSGSARLLAIGRAYVGFASAERFLFRLMFSEIGARCAHANDRAGHAPTSAFQHLRAALADVVDESAEKVDPALLAMAWSIAHGAASLICDGVWKAGDPRADAALKMFVRVAEGARHGEA